MESNFSTHSQPVVNLAAGKNLPLGSAATSLACRSKGGVTEGCLEREYIDPSS